MNQRSQSLSSRVIQLSQDHQRIKITKRRVITDLVGEGWSLSGGKDASDQGCGPVTLNFSSTLLALSFGDCESVMFFPFSSDSSRLGCQVLRITPNVEALAGSAIIRSHGLVHPWVSSLIAIFYYSGCITLFVRWNEDYPLADELKMPSHIGSYDGKGDLDNFLHLFEGAIRMQNRQCPWPVTCSPTPLKIPLEYDGTYIASSRRKKKALELSLLGNDHSSDPVIIKSKISERQVNQVYMDSESSYEVIYEECFLQLKPSIRSLRVDSKVPLVGFSGEHTWPLRKVPLEITIGLLLPPASIELPSCLHNSSALLENGVSNRFLSKGIGLKLNGPSSTLKEHFLGLSFILIAQILSKVSWMSTSMSSLESLLITMSSTWTLRFRPIWLMNTVSTSRWDEEKAAFFTREGMFCYKRLPFGLKSTGATYQRLVDTVFINQIGRNLKVHVDDMTLHFLKVLKNCANKKVVQWMQEAEEAFHKMKEYIETLPTVTAPIKGETLVMYLAVSKESISAVLLTKRGNRTSLEGSRKGKVPNYGNLLLHKMDGSKDSSYYHWDAIERDLLPPGHGPYYMPYPYDEGSADCSPPYTKDDWEEIHGVNLGRMKKELYKDPKVDDGTLNDGDQGDDTEFAAEDIESFNDVSQDKEVATHVESSEGIRRTTKASSHVPVRMHLIMFRRLLRLLILSLRMLMITGMVVGHHYEARVANTIRDAIERDLLPPGHGPYYMPYPYDEGSADCSPPYTKDDWEEIHGVNLGRMKKELYKDPKVYRTYLGRFLHMSSLID
nr:hypothetical protein [Tanacetum cinerariifolium]